MDNPEPAHSCSTIDRAIRDFKDGMYYIASALKAAHYIEDGEDIVSDLESAECEFYDIIEKFEYCRQQCSDLRDWGQDWKHEAMRLEEKDELRMENEILSKNSQC